jgi:hypothetical protein
MQRSGAVPRKVPRVQGSQGPGHRTIRFQLPPDAGAPRVTRSRLLPERIPRSGWAKLSHRAEP